jgi:methyltransferase (TIGR00027 family)
MVERGPSGTAQLVAMFRSLATVDPREEVRGRDTLAALFLTDRQRRPLSDPSVRAWVLRSPASAGAYAYLLCRTAYFDQIVERSLREGVPQIVFVGAGYDTRAYRYGALAERTRIFELDAPATQSLKIETLKEQNVAMPPGLVFVPADLREKGLSDALRDAGFDQGQKTLFVLEGLLNYLPPEVVDKTLACVRQDAGSGSEVCLDLKCRVPQVPDAPAVERMTDAGKAFFENEPALFAIDLKDATSFLSERGFKVEEDLTADGMEQRFLRLRDGSLAGKVPVSFRILRASITNQAASAHQRMAQRDQGLALSAPFPR